MRPFDQRFAFPSKAYPKLLTERGKITWEQFAELELYARASANYDFERREVRYIKVESHGCKQNVFDSFSRLVEIQTSLIEQ